MVVSFMIRGSFALAPPLVGGLTPATNTTAPIRHRLPDFFHLMPRIRNFKGGRDEPQSKSVTAVQDLDKLPIAEQISARIEAARTALAAAAGVGAAVTLMLAVRRQRHQKLATWHTTHDAAERRVTELYTKAAEQLGNARAPVGLAGLYALERLAQDTACWPSG
ncbi:hypothetical protein GCM10010412_064280 [Nonomuraea recticatena]|uniref:Uncharacterized protein n=1 Tax=Nonomuraea recticatena TaxID=46178 RepID=A0ABN3SLY2_9ACTN